MKATHKRLFWAVTLPLLALPLAVLMVVLTKWLGESTGGMRLLMLVAATIGCMSWTTINGSNDDA